MGWGIFVGVNEIVIKREDGVSNDIDLLLSIFLTIEKKLKLEQRESILIWIHGSASPLS